MWSKLPLKLKILLGSMILANIGGRLYRPFMPLYILSLGGTVAQVGVFFTVNTVSPALLRPLEGWFSDSIGRIQAVGLGTLFGLGGMLGYALSPSWEWLLISAVVLAFGRATVGPSFRAYTAEVAPPGQIAQTFGLVKGLFKMVDVIGLALGGWVVTRFGLSSLFWLPPQCSPGLLCVPTLSAVGCKSFDVFLPDRPTAKRQPCFALYPQTVHVFMPQSTSASPR